MGNLAKQVPETESWSVGPAARLFEATPDARGALSYHLEGHRPRTILLGEELAGVPLGIISVPALLAHFRIDQPDVLAGLTFFLRDEAASLVYGPAGPAIVRGDGRMRPLPDPIPAITEMRARALVDPELQTIAIAFLLNVNNRARFAEDLLRLVRDTNHLNRLEIRFEAATGEFREAFLTAQDKATQKLLHEAHSTDFPIVFPSRPKERTRYYTAAPDTWLDGTPRTDGAQGHGSRTQTGPMKKVVPDGPPGAPPSRPASPAAPHVSGPPPLPRTATLAIEEAVEAIRAEKDPDRRWLMLNDNLRLLKPERTMKLVGRFGDEIAERTAMWPARRVVEVLGDLPHAALEHFIPVYRNDVVLALLAEERPGRDRLMRVWEESEAERLMAGRARGRVETRDEARALLRLGESADKAVVRKVWRTLLAFLNADFGRRQETALHQKKDEIAKRLQMARDVLTR